VVVPREEDLARDEQPLPPAEVGLLPPAPGLMPSLPEPRLGPEVETPTDGEAPSGEIREEVVANELEVPPVEPNSPPVSEPPPLERGQRTRQPPAYLRDYICDCVQSGKYVSPAGCDTGESSVSCGSCGPHVKTNFCMGGAASEINSPVVKCSSHTPQPRCPAFSYADAVKSRRASSHS